MTPASIRKKRLLNAGAAMLSFVCAIAVAEGLLRLRYAERSSEPMPEVVAIQKYLTTKDKIGFSWRADVNPDERIVFQYRDAVHRPLSTDECGFINAPEAIAERRNGRRVDVIALGDSFMEHAAYEMHSAFEAKDLFHYNLALHRQSTPQYNLILETHALDLEPRAILYGLYENDFAEATDFDNWRNSRLDWFAFHSGTWCGAPLDPSSLRRFSKRTFKGFGSAFRLARTRLRDDGAAAFGPSEEEVRKVSGDIQTAHGLASERKIHFLLLLIPSRTTILEGDTSEAKAYDSIIRDLADASVPFIDLRKTFREHPAPATLYYEEDGHWNSNGIGLAYRVILGHLESASIVSFE